jgi:PAS domain S-box-containing protein
VIATPDFGAPSGQRVELREAVETLPVLKAALASSLCGVAICNQFGQVALTNHEFDALFGYGSGDLFGRDFATIVPETALGSTHAVRELNGVRRDGTVVPIRLRVTTFHGREPLYIASVIDLSWQRNLETRLETASSREQFQAALSDFAARCAAAAFDRVPAALAEGVIGVADALHLDRCVAFLPSDSSASRLTPAWRWGRSGGQTPAEDFDALEALPSIMAEVREGGVVCAPTLDDVPESVDRESLRALNVGSCAFVPVGVHGARGALLADASRGHAWSADAIEGVRLFASVLSQALVRTQDPERLDARFDELKRQRDQTRDENAILRREVGGHTHRTIAAESVAIRRVLEQVHQVAPTTATVLLLGETGAGKEVFAQAIHNLSPRQRRPMIRVSCAAIPSALIESELFGRERGAFTGALSRQIGRFEAANGSTIFLDEIGDLPLEIQVKLLRVLQERTVERLGGNQSLKVDVRVIAATNRNLEQAVANNTFREDLFYRLNVFPITIPPLRDRIDDIPSLVWTFIDEFSHSFGKNVDSISKESLAALQRYAWPGNVRELRNVIEREMIVANGSTLVVAAPRPVAAQRRAASSKLVDVEVEHIRSVLDSCRWRVRGSGGAAERLGVKPTTLESRMARLGITREKPAN